MSELPSKTATEWSEVRQLNSIQQSPSDANSRFYGNQSNFLQIWKDWRSKSSKIEVEVVFQPECNWKSELQLQNGITALVKELTVFIAADNGSFTINASLEKDVELLELPLKPNHKHPE